jgi:hypothetical protein
MIVRAGMKSGMGELEREAAIEEEVGLQKGCEIESNIENFGMSEVE